MSLKITVDHTKIGATLKDYPILVRAPGVTGYKHKVTSGGTPCPAELIADGLIYVKAPSLSPTTDTILLLDPTNTEDLTLFGGVLDPVAPKVWSSYASVLHLQGNAYDSGPLRNHGVASADVKYVPARVGLGAQFTGANQITLADRPEYSPPNNGGKLCVSFEIRVLDVNYSGWLAPLGKTSPCEWKFNIDQSNKTRRFYVFSSDCGYGSGATTQDLFPPTQANVDYLLHGQVFGGMVALYENGAPGRGTHGVGGEPGVDKGWNHYGLGEGVPDSKHIALVDTMSPVMIGRSNQQAGPKSIISEVRILRDNPSIAWMTADYYQRIDQLVKVEVVTPTPVDPCAQYKIVIDDLTTRLTKANSDYALLQVQANTLMGNNAILQQTVDGLRDKILAARVDAEKVVAKLS